MSFNELEKKRYSCRNYSDKKVKMDDLRKIVNAGRISPTSRNSQPISYYVVTSNENVLEMRKDVQALGGNAFCENVSAFIVLTIDQESYENKLAGNRDYTGINTGIVVHAMCLEATDLGLATCMLGRFDRKLVAKMIDFKEEESERIMLVIAIGYSNDKEIQDKDERRKTMEEVTKYL